MTESQLEELSTKQQDGTDGGGKAAAAFQDDHSVQRLFRTLVDVIPIGVVVADVDGNVLVTNAAGQEILGGDVTGNVERPQRSYIPCRLDGSHFPANEMPLRRALKAGETVREVELLLRREDGTERTIMAGAAPLRDERGDIVGGVTVFRDISARKRAEEDRERLLAFQQSQRSIMRTVMENTRAHLAYLDRDFNFLMVNSAYCAGCGYREEELIGRNHFELFPHAENQAIFERVRDTGRPIEFRAKPFVFANQPERGVTYWDWTLSPVQREAEEIEGLVLSLLDVTERERSHRAMSQLTDRLRLLHEADTAMLSAQSTADLADAVLRRLPAMLSGCVRASVLMFDLQTREMEVVSAHPAIHTGLERGWRGPIVPEWEGVLDRLAAGEVYTVEDMRAMPPSSTVVQGLQAQGVRAHLYWPLIADGRLLGSLNVGMNVPGSLASDDLDIVHELATELSVALLQAKLRAQVEEYTKGLEMEVAQRTAALIQAEKLALVGQLAASLAHELGNPLQSVMGCLELADESRAEGRDPGALLKIAMEELERALRILSQLRDFNRVSGPADRRQTDVADLLKRVAALTRKHAQRRHVDVELCLAEGLPPLILASERIQQVFLNIVMNAIQAMWQGGHLKITAQPTSAPAGITAAFADTGGGMSADTLSQLFRPFHTTKSDGLGLGLYVSHGIVKEHGGDIRVENRPGEGCTFHVWLPAPQASVSPSTMGPDEGLTSGGG